MDTKKEVEKEAPPKFAMLDIVLDVTSDRVDGLELDLLIKAQEADMRAMRDTLAHFLTDRDGNYVKKEVAQVVIGKMTIGQLKIESAKLQGALREDAAPKASEKASDLPSATT